MSDGVPMLPRQSCSHPDLCPYCRAPVTAEQRTAIDARQATETRCTCPVGFGAVRNPDCPRHGRRDPAHTITGVVTRCRVNWGSHSCCLPYGHQGPHECNCCECPDHAKDHEREGCVAKPPYYGPDTLFWGADADSREMPTTMRGS